MSKGQVNEVFLKCSIKDASLSFKKETRYAHVHVPTRAFWFHIITNLKIKVRVVRITNLNSENLLVQIWKFDTISKSKLTEWLILYKIDQ